MGFTIRQHAPQHSLYTEASVDHNIGRRITMLIPELNESRECTIRDAEVVLDGKAIDITFEICD